MTYDITIIRPEMREEQVKPRGRDLGGGQRKALRKALRTLHSLEIMAMNIYKCQITKDATPLNTALTERHVQRDDAHAGLPDPALRVRLHAGQAARPLLDGRLRLRPGLPDDGDERMLKTGIWVENKAVEHYGKLLAGADWDDETRVFIEKDRRTSTVTSLAGRGFSRTAFLVVWLVQVVHRRAEYGGRHGTLRRDARR